jgi:hypothetical protein
MTKRNFFLCTFILTLFLTACSNSDQKPTATPTAQPGQEVKAPNSNAATGATASTSDNPNAATGAVTSPTVQPVSTPPVDLANAPKIELVSKKIDFGKVQPDKKIVREFVVKNVGKSVLNIASVAPSCGCTTVDFPKTIAAGKSGKIKLQVETGQGSGVRTKTVTINSDDPQEKTVTVEFSFTLPDAPAPAPAKK